MLAQHQQQQQGVVHTSTTAHPTITDAVTLRLVPRRKKKVLEGLAELMGVSFYQEPCSGSVLDDVLANRTGQQAAVQQCCWVHAFF